MNLKFKIMDQPQVSDEEVKGYMDFESLLQHHNRIVQKRNLLIKSGVIVISVFTLLTVYFFFSPKNEMEIRPNDTSSVTGQLSPDSAAEEPAETTLPEKDVLGVDATADQNSETIPQKRLAPEKQGSASVPEAGVRRPETHSSGLGDAQKDSDTVTESVYVQAEPVEGYEMLFQYFKTNLHYPAEAIKDSVQGVLTISFVITAEGKPASIAIEKTLGEPFEKEAIKLVEQMPQWKPATLNGKPVKSKVTLPLTFELKKVSHP